jgi:phenylalanyl-tRNA synthetase beta subunit
MHHPDTGEARAARGGIGGASVLQLPKEDERFGAVVGGADASATMAVGIVRMLAERMGLQGVEFVDAPAPAGWHPTRYARVLDETTGAVLGSVGEADPEVLSTLAGQFGVGRRVALVDLDLSAWFDETQATRSPLHVSVPSRFPSALFDLAFLVPSTVSASTLRRALASDERVEHVELFDVYNSDDFGDARSVSFSLRATLASGTIDEATFVSIREGAIERAASLGATLR